MRTIEPWLVPGSERAPAVGNSTGRPLLHILQARLFSETGH